MQNCYSLGFHHTNRSNNPARPRLCLRVGHSWRSALMRVVHLGRSTCHAISDPLSPPQYKPCPFMSSVVAMNIQVCARGGHPRQNLGRGCQKSFRSKGSCLKSTPFPDTVLNGQTTSTRLAWMAVQLGASPAVPNAELTCAVNLSCSVNLSCAVN